TGGKSGTGGAGDTSFPASGFFTTDLTGRHGAASIGRVELLQDGTTRTRVTASRRTNHASTNLPPAGRGRAGPGLVGSGHAGQGTGSPGAAALPHRPQLLPLPLLLLPAQLLADDGPSLPGTAGQALHAAAGVHGLSPLQGTALAL